MAEVRTTEQMLAFKKKRMLRMEVETLEIRVNGAKSHLSKINPDDKDAYKTQTEHYSGLSQRLTEKRKELDDLETECY